MASYIPDDSRLKVAAVEALHSPAGAELRAALAALPDANHLEVSQVAALRKKYSADLLHAGLALAAVQAKAKQKFPDLPFVWATPEALEQASSAAVARHKASRFRTAGVARILDLCCGIGGDTLALADVAPVTAVDLSAVRTQCLRYNLEQVSRAHAIEIRTGDLREMLPTLHSESVFHIDPSRRQMTAGGRMQRSAKFEDLIPGPEVLELLMRRFAGGVIKLSSAVEFESLPSGHLELISERGSVVQGLLWVGKMWGLAAEERTATVIPHVSAEASRRAWSFSARPEPITLSTPPTPPDPLRGILHELDGTLTPNLAAPYCLAKSLVPLTPDGGYALAPAPIDDAPLTPFEILQSVPFSETRVLEALQNLDSIPGAPAPIEVKTRGGLAGIDTDHLQRSWSKAAPRGCTVLIFRQADDVTAVIARRL